MSSETHRSFSGLKEPPFLLAVVAWVLLFVPAETAEAPAWAQEERDSFITVASTTSTENSGLAEWLFPRFSEETGIAVRLVSVGTGRALKLGEQGDVDVVLVHHRPSEDRFLADGFGVDRRDVMYNDYVLVGPESDPAGIQGDPDIIRSLKKIAAAEAPFVSRGDDSGTHKKELELWRLGDVRPVEESGVWYFETGSGQGATLNTAAQLNAYVLVDRGTWLSFDNRGTLSVKVEGGKLLQNPYGAILVNPERHPHIKRDEAMLFLDWLVSDPGREAIASFRIGGQPVFFPPDEAERPAVSEGR